MTQPFKAIPGCNRGPGSIDLIIGRKLRARRRQKNLTQKQLAEAIGMSTARLRSAEAGQIRLRPPELVAVAEELNTALPWFFFDAVLKYEADDSHC